jgi:protein arginine N-methyltransferase 5
LGDHLEYQTYETFEKDPVKYKRYGEAIENELIDGFRASKFPLLGVKRLTLRELKRLHGVESDLGTLGSEMHEVYVHEVTILVVGAGRGPLVKEAIGAVARASGSIEIGGSLNTIHAKIIAIEKNPSAVLYLQSLKASDPSWNDRKDPHHDDDMFDPNDDDDIANPGTSNVTVICCDMREATSHPILRNMIMNERSRADIVVSELLGSFGDNELSPECLDGVQKCGILKVNCVSIPQRYVLCNGFVQSIHLPLPYRA